MREGIIPSTYEEWVHCIVVECGLELTSNYIEQRIAALQEANDYYTQQFIKLYGQAYLEQVLSWFSLAKSKT